MTEGGEGQISHRTGPKSDLLLDPQLPVSFGADVAAKVAAAGLHLEAEVVEGRLGSGAVVGPYDKYTFRRLREIAKSGANFLESEKKLSQVSEAAPCACIIGVPGLLHCREFKFQLAD